MDNVRKWTKEIDLEHKGIDIVIKPAAIKAAKARKVDLDVDGIELKELLKLLTKAYGVKMRVDSWAVVIMPKSDPDPFRTLYIKVPPDFLNSANLGR